MEINRHAASNAVFKVRDEIVHKQIGDVRALLDLKTGAFYTLNETASIFWGLVEEGMAIEDICVYITEEYNVSRDEVWNDLSAFIDFFVQEQMLIP